MSSPLDPDSLSIPAIDAAASARGGDMIFLAGGTPHPTDLPLEQLREALDGALSPASLAYGASRGEPELLEALREHFAATEGIDASPERTMVTSGAMPALDLVFRRALALGDLAVVESPTYSDSLIALALARARIAELPMDEEGLVVEELAGLAARLGAPRLIYSIPNFHNPTGATLSLERRRRLVELASEQGALLVDDDAYGPFRFGEERLPSLASLSEDVVAVRSLSKIVAPGLRVGCVIGPPAFMRQLEQLRGGTDICSSPLAQAAVARFVRSGAIGPHVERLRDLFRARRDAMLTALGAQLGDLGASWSVPQGGMFVWVRLPAEVDAVALLDRALDEGVAFVPGSVFSYQGHHRNCLRLCYAGVEPERIEAGVARLRAALEGGAR